VGRAPVRHVVLVLTAVNHVDHTAAQALLELDKALAEQHKRLYLCEIKGPVIDRLQAGLIAAAFEGRMFISAQHAWDALA
jgi:SulP family sulfate permease